MSQQSRGKVALIGLGLIGSSLALAIRQRGLATTIAGHARSATTRATALRIGLCDSVHDTPAEAVRDASMVVLCTPVGVFGPVLRQIAPALAEGAVVTDVGGAKASVAETVAPLIPAGCAYVPGHPIAGTEQSGPESGFAELFDGNWCILTPLPGTDRSALARVRALWEGVGSKVTEMSPEHHDQVLAVTSHLPHAIAYTMVRVADQLASVSDSEVIQYSASGFRDFTRIAASAPEMWRDIFLANREAILEGLGHFNEELFALQKAIRWRDGEELERILRRGQEVRRGILDAGQDASGRRLFLVRSGEGAEAEPEDKPGDG